MSEPLAEFRDAIAEICRRRGVQRLELFGSVARGEDRPSDSDVDVMVLFADYDRPGIATDWFGLEEDLASLLGRKVDLLSPRTLRNPFIKATIDRDKVLLYAA